MALGLEPLGWAQERQAPASLPSVPGWLGSLCPRFHAHHPPSPLRSKKSPELASEELLLCVPGDSESSLSPLDLAPGDLAQDGGFSLGVPKMLEAILFFLTGCSVGSSKPNEKLDPLPGGRKTRELFLLLGSTPLKVVIVVMAKRGEVGPENAEWKLGPTGADDSTSSNSRAPRASAARAIFIDSYLP